MRVRVEEDEKEGILNKFLGEEILVNGLID